MVGRGDGGGGVEGDRMQGAEEKKSGEKGKGG